MNARAGTVQPPHKVHLCAILKEEVEGGIPVVLGDGACPRGERRRRRGRKEGQWG
jgi:hypothetical protein